MDTISHGLAGVLAAKAGFRQRLGPYATAALLISAVFPDVDFVASLWGPFASLKFHRSITHSFLGVTIAAFLLGGIFRLLSGRKNYWGFTGICAIGTFSHMIFDLLTSFGTQLFYPFSTERYSLDWIFILDPVITLSALVPLILMRGRPARALRCARVGVAVLVGYLVITGIGHSIAVKRFEASLKEAGIRYDTVAALPGFLGPFRWSGLAKGEGTVYRSQFNILFSSEVKMEKFVSSAPNRYIEAARDLDEVKLYLWFARFPVEIYFSNGQEHTVEYSDVRFRLSNRRNPFFLKVVMNEEARVVRVEF